MTRLCRAACIGCVTAASLVTGASAQDSRARRENDDAQLAIAYEAFILPIARHTGTAWLNTWPAPEDMDVPVPALDRIPRRWLGVRVPRVWTLWFTTGGSVTAGVARSERSGGCIVSPNLPLTAAPTPPESLFDRVHVGLATAGRKMPVTAITRVTDADSAWQDIGTVARATLAEHEHRIVADYADEELRGVLTDAKLASVDAVVDWVFAPARAGRPDAYAFEVSKQVAHGENVYRVIVAGWVIRDAMGAVTAHDVTRHFTWEPDAADLPRLVPLGIVSPNGRDVWVQEDHPGEVTTFRLVEVTSRGVRTLLTIDGGGC